jgi:trk system potassium uptake protein
MWLQKPKNLVTLLLNFLALVFVADLFFKGTILTEISWEYSIWSGLFLILLNDFLQFMTEKKSVSFIVFKLPDFLVIFLFIFFSRLSSKSIIDLSDLFLLYLLGRQTLFLIRDYTLQGKNTSLYDKLAENPPGFLIFSFIFTIFAGTLLLLIPVMTAENSVTSLLDALFTATSATCVTGLIVQDTGTHFTLYGQIVILLLIQIGGLGIMTISSAFAVMLGQKLTVKSEHLIQNMVGESNRVDMTRLVKSIVSVTFIIEIIGAFILYFSLKDLDLSFKKTIYHSVFHSVSAFCNAGFSLYKDSFMGYAPSFNINFAITGLIILGGIGFPVMVDFQNTFRKSWNFKRLSLHTKIVLTTTGILLCLGTIAFFISEYYQTMAGWSLKDRFLGSFFQSVTTRTAGFNTIDTGNMSSASKFVSIVLMFIGASPGSTGGGIKTTTFFVLVFSVFSLIKGNRDVNIFQRKVAEDTIKKIMAIIALSILLLSIMIFLLLMIEGKSAGDIVFESVSAFGTVGLSTGITGALSAGGKIIIILLMYIGRVGPLTMVLAFSQANMQTNYQLVEEKISIG